MDFVEKLAIFLANTNFCFVALVLVENFVTEKLSYITSWRVVLGQLIK